MPEKDPPQPKARVSRLAEAAFICLLVAFAIEAVGTLVAMAPDFRMILPLLRTLLRPIVVAFGPIAGPALGIAALIAIARSGGTLRGEGIAMAAILIPSVMAITSGLDLLASKKVHSRSMLTYEMLCGTNMKGIANAFLVYAQANDDRLPDAEHWCDLLVMKADISPAAFCCKATGDVKGESSYAMNVAVAGVKLADIPKEMVVLFEAASDRTPSARDFPLADRQYIIDFNHADVYREKGTMVSRSRWNQVCGPERIDVSAHKNGCNILFGDMHVEFVKTQDLPSLRWVAEGKVDFTVTPIEMPKPATSRWPIYVIIAAGAAVILLLVVLCIVRSTRTPAFFLAIALAAGIAGMYLGHLSEQAHGSSREPGYVGGLIGLVVGLAAGPLYVAFIRARVPKFARAQDARDYAIATGMITGIICAVVVHLVLMAIHHGGHIEGLIHGPYFGLVAGGLVGLVAAFFIHHASPPQQSVNRPETTDA